MGAGPSPVLASLNIYLNDQPLVKAGKYGQQSLKRTSSAVRMLGRDVLRLGGIIGKFGNFLAKVFNFMATSSLDLGGAIEDIKWSFEDIFASIGDALAPVFEFLADVMDQVADVFEALPEGVKGAIGIFILLGIVALKLMTIASTLIGTWWMLKGIFMNTTPEVSKLVGAIGGRLLPAMGGLTKQSQQLLMVEQQLAVLQNKRSIAMGKYNKALIGGDISANKYKTQIKNLGDQMKVLQKQEKKSAKGEKKRGKAQKKAGKGMKGWITTIGKMAAWMGVFTVIMLILAPLIEMLSPIFEAIAYAMEAVLEPLEPIIDFIADWIEENPELAAGIMIGVVAAITALLLKGGPLLSLLSKAIPLTGTLTGAVTKGASGFLQFAAAVFLIAAGVALLVWSITELLKVMIANNVTLGDLIKLMAVAFSGIFLFLGAMVALGYAAIGAAPGLLALGLALLMAGAGALMFGAGIALAGAGVFLAAAGIKMLVSHVPQVLALVPAMIALAAGIGLVGMAAAILAIAGLGATLALLGMAVGVTALAGAFYLLAAALRGIPDWAKGFVSGLGGMFGGIFGGIPLLQEGGVVRQGGLAYLEPAEVVVPAGETMGGAPHSIYNTYYVSAVIREEADIDKLAKKVSEKQSEQYGSRQWG